MSARAVKSPADLVSGLMFTGIGILALVVGSDYPLGELRRMGPGMLPTLVAWLLTATGVALSVQGVFVGGDRERTGIDAPGFGAVRAALFVLLALLVFALLIRPAGMFLAVVALVLVSTRAERGYPVLTAIILALAMAVLSVLIFVYGLGLPFKVWP